MAEIGLFSEPSTTGFKPETAFPFLASSAMSEKRDERLAKLYIFLEDGEWKEELMGIVVVKPGETAPSDHAEENQFVVILDPNNEGKELRRIRIRKDVQYQASDSM